MKKKFSKGEWRISNSGAFIESENGVIAAVSLSTQENINNAKLIAAAPELLDACVKIAEYIELRNISDSEAYFIVKKAIKKATE